MPRKKSRAQANQTEPVAKRLQPDKHLAQVDAIIECAELLVSLDCSNAEYRACLEELASAVNQLMCVIPIKGQSELFGALMSLRAVLGNLSKSTTPHRIVPSLQEALSILRRARYDCFFQPKNPLLAALDRPDRPAIVPAQLLGQSNIDAPTPAAAQGEGDGESETPKLSQRQHDILQKLLHLRAFDCESRATTKKIAELIDAHLDPDSLKGSVAILKRNNLIGTQVGSGGGCWLTTQGKSVWRKIRRKSVSRKIRRKKQ